jgi:two-component system osmolarity sensor histidine kinase EnvZ
MLLAVHIGYRLIASVSLTGDDDFPGSALPSAATYTPYAPPDDASRDSADIAGIGPALSIRPQIVDLRAPLAPSLRAAVWLPAAPMSTNAFAAADADEPSVSSDTPFLAAFDTRFAPLILSLPATLVALCAYWFCQTRRGLRELTQMARIAGSDGTALCTPGRGRGMRDDRRLAGTLSELMCRHSQALDDQSTALAAFSRQIDARVARLRTRPLNVAQWHKRVAFIEDIDLFSNVARQFVEVAGRSDADAAHVGVDAYLRDRFFHGAAMHDARIVLRLNAGADFTLPHNALERLIGNLVGNALAHGAPPVEIRTTRGVRTWMLSVRDHGKGIDESELAGAMQPFVRLAANEATQASEMHGEHWGLGLSIVSRLAQHCGVKLKLGNHPEGGLWVRVIVAMREPGGAPCRSAQISKA